MALTITERAALSDVGRQRQANEDSFVEAPPFFAVADGMGGAKAGEVASQIAVEAFDEVEGTPDEPEGGLREIAQSANRRIYDLAQAEESRRGMGTTLTAALVGPDGVSLGHVGDSRCYLLRDGELEQLTRDHSLVAELERTGQIAPGEAENHPQRSIITRALGPERDVDVDTYTITGRSGDVFLLCSDGLTSMISNDEIGEHPARGRLAGGGSGLAGASREPERRQGQHHRRAVPAGRRRGPGHDRRHHRRRPARR